MSNNFDDLKNIWQQVKSDPVEYNQLISKLKRMERKSKIEQGLLLFLFPMTLIALLILLPFTKSIYYLISISLFGIGMLMILFQIYQSRIKHNIKQDSLSNKEFVNNMIMTLHRKMKITSRYLWIYTILLITGINIGYIEVLAEMILFHRLLVHFAISIVVAWFMYSSINKRIIKNKRENLPIIENLKKIQDELANA